MHSRLTELRDVVARVIARRAPGRAPPSNQPTSVQASVKESRIPAEKIRNVINAEYAAPKRDAVREARTVEAAYLPGEDSYMRTISDLNQSVNGQKDRVLTPSSRIASTGGRRPSSSPARPSQERAPLVTTTRSASPTSRSQERRRS